MLEKEVARLQHELLQKNHQFMSLQGEYRSAVELIVKLQAQLKKVIGEERERAQMHAALIEQYELELNRLRRDYPLRQLLMVKETEIARLETHLNENRLEPTLQSELEKQLHQAKDQRDRITDAIHQTEKALSSSSGGGPRV